MLKCINKTKLQVIKKLYIFIEPDIVENNTRLLFFLLNCIDGQNTSLKWSYMYWIKLLLAASRETITRKLVCQSKGSLCTG